MGGKGGGPGLLFGFLLFAAGAAAGVLAGASLRDAPPAREEGPRPPEPLAPPPAPAPAAGRKTVPVLVLVDPPGAAVSVDGADRGVAGPDGLLIEDLDPAIAHTIRASLEGREPAEAALFPGEGGRLRVFRLTLAIPVGEVLLRYGRAGTVVVAVASGRPPREITVPADGDLGPLRFEAGEYVFSISLPGFETRIEADRVDAGAVTEIDASLAERDGALSLDSDPPGAEVTLDDRALGAAPLAAVPVAPGTHQIRLIHPGADDLSREVTIRGESLEDLGVLRMPPLGVLDLTRLPEGVRAAVDGRPATGKVRRRPGSVVVVLSRDGYFDQEVTVPLMGGKESAPAVGKWNDVPGTLDLARIPADVVVLLNGREVARGPGGSVRVPPGKIRLTLDGPGLGTVIASEVAVEAGQTVAIPAPAWKVRELRPAVAGLSAAPRQDRRGASLPPGVVERSGRLLSTRDGAELAMVPSAEFMMGSDDGDKSERPARPVLLAAFLLDRHEVTNAQFSEFTAATGYVTDAEREGWSYDHAGKKATGFDWQHPDGPESSIQDRDTLPAIFVAWNDARAYAAWAGRRLPTEAELERAIRGGVEGGKYAWGDEIPPRSRVANLFDESGLSAHPKWKGSLKGYRDGFPGASPAGSFPANPFGLFDVVGNASEWCADGYEAGYYAVGPRGNPPGPDPARSRYRVHRGGSWATDQKNIRSANRGYQLPGTRHAWLGFRCAADLGPPQGK